MTQKKVRNIAYFREFRVLKAMQDLYIINSRVMTAAGFWGLRLRGFGFWGRVHVYCHDRARSTKTDSHGCLGPTSKLVVHLNHLAAQPVEL